MFINPSTNIRILKDVPLDNTYQHTIYFNSASAQYSYFIGKQKYNLANYSYQRVQKGKARIGLSADNLYDCNYMMFQNLNFGNKWFYAFITSVEYINNVTAEITFEIDVMQTWHFNYDVDMCFVERNHTRTDAIGEHLEAEPVATGEYVFNDYTAVNNMTDMCVIIAICDVEGDTPTSGTLYDGVYGGAQLFAYASTDVQGINGKLGEYVQKSNAIVGVYMCPSILIGSIPSDHKLAYGASGVETYVKKDAVNASMRIDGYKPRNKKLYSYPYNFYHVDNGNGSSLALRYEFFDGHVPVLEIGGTVTQPCEVTLRPCSYKGVPQYTELGGYNSLNTETLTIKGYPLCSWNVDSYQAWVAQNSLPIVLNATADSAKVGIAAGLGVGGPATIAAGAIGEVASVASQAYQASIAADMSKGTFNNGGANVALHKQQFYGGRCSVNRVQAKIIDDFFSLYGYAIKQVVKPNRNARPHWNYVKTIGCVCTGSVPSDDMNKICSIYDHGITFWNNGNEIGQYSLDNSPS
jgi:hypothetical protein